MTLPQSVAPLLEKSRLELLDLTTRNRLLNLPLRTRHAKTVRIVDERAGEVYRLLVKEGRTLTFLPGRDPDAAEGGEQMALLPQPEDEEPDERGVARRHGDTRLQTQLTSEALQKRLLSIFYDARTFIEEQGVNILYLAVGLLKWREADASEADRHAPLILVPVALERQSAAARFRMRWLQEDPAPNLSLIAKLRSDFGIVLPDFAAPDESFEPDAYCAAVAEAVAARPGWEVLPDAMALGFFSFAKFLMFRDLDPASWPADAPIDRNPLLAGLLRDGFAPADDPIGEDGPIDPHFPAADLVHVVDADSSQTLAIAEARRGRNLVIQGPPGTGKSQTIANVIAAAVKDGEKVLFVAEKMAALDVVKRRLDAIGLGAMCLELHSNKANKRAVLEELRRTRELGPPRGADGAPLLERLDILRERLNRHAAILHAPLEPSRLTPYAVIGQLVRLAEKGVRPTDLSLDRPENWTPQDKAGREQALQELTERVGDLGLPAAHPWRGIGLDAVLRTDLDRLCGRIAALRGQIELLLEQGRRLHEALGLPAPASFAELGNFAVMAEAAADAPDLDRTAIADPVWDRPGAIADLVAAGALHTETRAALADIVAEAGWTTNLADIRRHLAARGRSWFRWLSGDYRWAKLALGSILVTPPPKPLEQRLALLDRILAAQNAARLIERDDALGRSAFGALWRRERTDWAAARAILDWVRGHAERGLPPGFRAIFARIANREPVIAYGRAVGEALPPLLADLDALFADLRLDLPAAFGAASVRDLSPAALRDRLALWLDEPEELSKWIAFRLRADAARRHGLGAFAAALSDGTLTPDAAADAFDMAWHEALMRTAVARHPELASFDGAAWNRLVDEFRDVDRQRLDLARLEVAQAHYETMPRGSSGIGALGVLSAEIAKKRRHLPIRQLMRQAGPAIQALKPVFMMSPLSVAQFLEPGGPAFDLLVIDEASQVQPVDALGAIARCRRIVVVGDDRQLPPTRFFARMTGDLPDTEEDEELAVGDVESVLGLCAARGLPQRMLRWHYRSRHHSLIAVSNREFYDSRLHVVPSPWAEAGEAGLGLRFNHLPDGRFDRGGSRTNCAEAQAVAAAVMDHARRTPHLSLGVAAFSIQQRQAILDELERLRRAAPDAEPFFDGNAAEPFFVKNLENVQGDERDVIFISIGYGKDASGYMAMRFGPLSAEGGERRLNVLISRARRRCELFSSITAEDIDLERGRGRGVAALKTFLHFARTGQLDIAAPTGRGHDSVFEEQVARALAREGYDVRPQIGLAGFFIDLAVVDPDRPGHYLLGIECDGASYHSARSARDRDRLRQAVLEDHGWTLHRIWSTDWFQRPQEQLRRAVAAIEAARAAPGGGRPPEPAPPDETPVARGAAGPAAAEDFGIPTEPYREAAFEVPAQIPPHELPMRAMARIVAQIVEAEGPVHVEEITARVRALWALGRSGPRIQAAVRDGVRMACMARRIEESGGFCAVPGQEIPIRDRSAVASPGLRRPDMLPPAEIRAAIRAVVAAHRGARRPEIAVAVARLFGFRATGSQLREAIERELTELERSRELVGSGDVLRLAS